MNPTRKRSQRGPRKFRKQRKKTSQKEIKDKITSKIKKMDSNNIRKILEKFQMLQTIAKNQRNRKNLEGKHKKMVLHKSKINKIGKMLIKRAKHQTPQIRVQADVARKNAKLDKNIRNKIDNLAVMIIN